MKLILSAILVLLPGAALAHVGHLGEFAGHDHVVAGVAIGAAIGVAAWGWLKGSKSDDEAAEEIETEEAEA